MIPSTFQKTFSEFFVACNRGLQYSKRFPWFSILFVILTSKSLYRTLETTEFSPWASFQNFSQSLTTPRVKKEKKISEKAVQMSYQQPLFEKTLDVAQTKVAMTEDSLNVRLRAVENQLANSQKSLEALQKIHATLIQDIQLAHGRLDSLQQRVEQVLTYPESGISGNKSAELHQYSVYAIVQGRAWIRTPEQGIITVREGDPVLSLGIVERIDRVHGLVYLDQGRVIQSSSRDS